MSRPANGPWTASHIIRQPAAEPFHAASDPEDPRKHRRTTRPGSSRVALPGRFLPPIGQEEVFLASLEQKLGRILRRQKPGPKVRQEG